MFSPCVIQKYSFFAVFISFCSSPGSIYLSSLTTISLQSGLSLLLSHCIQPSFSPGSISLRRCIEADVEFESIAFLLKTIQVYGRLESRVKDCSLNRAQRLRSQNYNMRPLLHEIR